MGFTFRDLSAGTERLVVDPRACECDQFVDTAWSPDGAHVAILTGHADGRLSVRDLSVLPAGAGTWDQASVFEPRELDGADRWLFWPAVTYLSPTELAVLEYEERLEWSIETPSGFPLEVPATASLVVLDARDGTELRRVAVPDLGAIGWSLAPAPDGDGVIVTTVALEDGVQVASLHRIRDDGGTELLLTGYQAITW